MHTDTDTDLLHQSTVACMYMDTLTVFARWSVTQMRLP